MPHDITHRDAVEMTVEKAREGLLRRQVRVRSLTAVAQQQAEVAAGQRRDHEEMVGADAVMKVIGPVGETVEVDVEVLKEAAGVVFAFNRHSQSPADTGIDAIGSHKVLTTDKLFLVVAIVMGDAGGNAVAFERQILERPVVFDGAAKARAGVVADKGFCLALVVREDAVVTRIDGRVVETGTDFRPLAVSQEVHDVAFAPEIAIEDTLAEFLVDEVEKFDGARMHGDGAGFPAGAGHALDASIFDAASSKFHGEDAPDGAASDNEDRSFRDSWHTCSSRFSELSQTGRLFKKVDSDS